MKMIDDVIIIGIDSGYGNIKTANCCFPASVSAYDKEPVFKENLLVYESKFYLIGEGHKEFLADKTKDLDYGSALVPFINRFPQNTKLYQLMTTRPGEGKFARGGD